MTEVVIWSPNRISENRNREGEVSREKSPFRFFVRLIFMPGTDEAR
jgi:hypothetical protein